MKHAYFWVAAALRPTSNKRRRIVRPVTFLLLSPCPLSPSSQDRESEAELKTLAARADEAARGAKAAADATLAGQEEGESLREEAGRLGAAVRDAESRADALAGEVAELQQAAKEREDLKRLNALLLAKIKAAAA